MKRKTVRGIISMTRRGVGYVTPAHVRAIDDIEVREDRQQTALHRDTVEVRILGEREQGRMQGEVLSVLARSREMFVGVLYREGAEWFLKPDEERVRVNFAVSAPRGKQVKLAEGHKALMEMKPWRNPKEHPRGVVRRMLGEAGAADTERNAIVFSHGFDTHFPKPVRAEADALLKKKRVTEDDRKNRKDFRNIPTMTIDPEDAKDFDDALSVRQKDGGEVEVGVHIADVSHYVRAGSELDKEAARRGTSVYLVGETIPMLPEALSNDLCSLNPNEEKLTFSAVFTFSKDGTLKDEWFGRTIIRSDKRFTYTEAQKLIDSASEISTKGRTRSFALELSTLNTIAEKLRIERFKKGAIDFDADEVAITLQDGTPTAITKKERLATHRLVEEWMLLANRRVAWFVYAKQKKESGGSRVFVYRVHDTPDRDKLEELSVFLKAIGYELENTKSGISSHNINALFREIAGKPEEELIKLATIRTMAKAVYTTKNIGHFGLAFRYYTHFTSPIRRYPDILVHRLLAHYLGDIFVPKDELVHFQKLALSSSEREVAAVAAERESIKYAQVRYMESRVGEEFDAIISGVTSWGLYVEEQNTKAEGLVRVGSLTGDYFKLDQKRYTLVGARTKKTYALGDRIRVRLTGADLKTRTLDFTKV